MPTNSASHESFSNDRDADATGQLDILDADDILESDDIRALEAAAAGIVSFEVAPADPSGFEVGELEELDAVEVEGEIEIEPPPPSLSTLLGVKSKPSRAALIQTAPMQAQPAQPAQPAPVEAAPVEAAPVQAEAAAIPAAPHTNPLPVENVVLAEADEPAPASVPDRTLELKYSDYAAAAAAAAAKVEAEEQDANQNAPGHTEVLHRSAMPSAIRTMHGGAQAPARRPSSIAPVALDVATRSTQRSPVASVPAFPPPARVPSYASMTPPKRGLSGLAVGVIAASALALVGLVGIGGYAASRALTEKAEPVAIATSDSPATGSVGTEGEPSSAVVAPAPTHNAPSAPEAAPASASTGSAIDVSALPTAAAPGPRGISGRTSSPREAAPLAAAGPVAPSAPANRASGGALPPPGGGKTASAPLAAPGAPLPPPPAPAAAPVAAPAAVATTGTVRVDPNLRAIQVDGSFRRPNDGVVVVACGSHRIKAGMKEQQTVNVPCGGSVSL